MAKIIIRGVGEIEISDERANYLKSLWDSNALKGRKVDLGDFGCYEGVDIRAIIPTQRTNQSERAEYNVAVDGPEKNKVKAFMAEFDRWKDAHPEVKEWHQWAYMQDKGAITMGEYRPDDTILNDELYQELQKLFASRQTLLYLRERAAAHNDPNFEVDRIKMFNDIKSKFSFKSFSKAYVESYNADLRKLEKAETENIRAQAQNPARQKLEADAKQFDIDNGIDEWRDIKPEDIPF